MKKKISNFNLIFILNIVFFNFLCLGNNRDILLKRNIFFEQGKDLLAGIEKIGSSSKDGLTSEIVEYNSLLQQVEILLNKLSENRFNSNNISSPKLDELLHQIADKKQKFLNNNKNRFLTKERKEAIASVFDSMVKGILLDLSFDHLTSLRGCLISHIKNILFLENYWKDEIDKTSLWKNDTILREKLKKLLFLKERTACFIGKMDEVSLSLFKIANDPAILNENLFDQVRNLVEQSIFSIYSFFSENFDPDKQIYNLHLLEFNKFDFQQKIRLLCKNHINVCMSEESLKFQLKDFEIPSFLKRHWVALSATSLALAGSGVLVYRNREYLFGGKCKEDMDKFYDEYIKKWVVKPFVEAKDSLKAKFFPNAYLKENKDTLTNASESLRVNLKEACESLAQKKIIDSFDEQELNDLDNLSKKLSVAFNKQRKIIFEDNYKEIKDLLDLFEKNMNKLNDHLPNVFCLLGLISREKAGDKSEVSNDSSSNDLDEKDQSKESTEWVITSFLKILPRLISMGKDATSNIAKIKKSKTDELDPAMSGLLGVINQFTHLIGNVGTEFSGLVVWFKVIEAMVCIYGINASKRVVGILDLAEAAERWVPIILTTIAVCIAAKTIYNHIVQERIKRNSLDVSEIYRTLIRYKSECFDIYPKDMKFKDQGMINFWLEVLSEDSQLLSRENKGRVSRLTNELENPERSVSQKIEFIKLEWGKYLFDVQVA